MRRQRQAKERSEKRKDRRPILKKLCAALLQLLRRQLAWQKMVCARGVLGVTRILGKANSHFDSSQKGLEIVPPG